MPQWSGSGENTVASESPIRLQRQLSLIETWGFGLTGLLLWMGVAPGAQHELGSQAMWVWLPGVAIGIMINLQVRQLGKAFPDVSGGTPNYLTHLLPEYPLLTRYAAIGYFISWVAVIPVNAMILTDLVKTNFELLGIALPETLLNVGFTVLAAIVALSGSHALGTLHLVFLLPAVGFLLAFCAQGIGWTVQALPAVSLLPLDGTSFSFQGWAKWYLNGTYAFYACETASAFVADSNRPQGTLHSLLVAAALMPLVYIGGSWLLTQLAIAPELQDNTFLSLLTAAQHFWGQSAAFLVTFLVVSSSLLACATAVAICPRILYQLAQDQHLAPVFGVTSRQGVFAPGIILTLGLSLGCLLGGNVHRIVMVTGVGWLVSFMVWHWGLWYQRANPAVLWPRCSLVCCGLEAVVLVVGGLAWGWPYLVLGLLLPALILLGDRALRQFDWAALQPEWWLPRPDPQQLKPFQAFIALQVFVLILFISGATIASWFVSRLVTQLPTTQAADLLVVLLLLLSFVGVAIACWTIFPQIVAVNQAREQAERSTTELQATLQQLQDTQLQLVQQEKMSSLGQLVAGVAHEINNPVNFIHGNVEFASEYIQDLVGLLQLYQNHYPTPNSEIQDRATQIDITFLQQDLGKILNSMQLGTDRIRQIVLSLRNFSRTDEAEVKAVDIHEGLESTLLILQHRLKAKSGYPVIQVLRDYQTLPLVECYPGQLNQVFMNILANAIDAIEEQFEQQTATGSKPAAHSQPTITIRTTVLESGWIQIAIADTGTGIPASAQNRIFDPFFTTKSIGKGTGMGMSISYQIVTEKHHGKLDYNSTVGEGTEFVIQLPMQRCANCEAK